jgi:hypothetical protein
MARKLVVEIVGNDRGLERTFRNSAKSAKEFDRSISHSLRGVASGSGALKGLGRSLAMASGGFVAFAGVTEFLRSSIDAAREAGVAQRQLAAQMKAVGETFKTNQGAIEKAGLAVEKFGFTSEDSARALTVLERGSGKITRAIQLQGVAANLARAKNIDLASAAGILAKVFGGQETALRRAVPGLDKHAHGLQLIAEAERRLSGQARAATTPAEKFSATLHDTEVIIGSALLPTLDKYLGKFSDWLDKMNRSGKLQRDVNGILKDAKGILQGVLDVVRPLAGAFKALGDAVGGTRNELKLLVGVFAAFKLTRWVSEFGGLGSGVKRVGTEAEASAGKVAGLRGALTRLAGIGLIAIPIELLINKDAIDKSVSGWLDKHGLPGGTNKLDPQQVIGNYGALRGTFGTSKANAWLQQAIATITAPVTQGIRKIAHVNFGPTAAAAAAAAAAAPAGPGGLGIPKRVSGFANAPLTAQQQLQLGLAAHPNALSLLRQQAAHDRAALAFAGRLRAENRITNAKYMQEVLGYQGDLTSTEQQIASLHSTAAAAAAKAKARSPRLGIPTSLSGSYRSPLIHGGSWRSPWLHGGVSLLDSYTEPLRLQLEAAKAGITRSPRDDLSVLRKMKRAAERALKSGKLAVQGQIDAYNEITNLNNQIAGIADPLAGLIQVSSKKLAGMLSRGTGLGLAGRRRLEYNLAGAEIQPIHVHVHMDSREVATAVTRQQARSNNRTSRQTSGFRG